MTNKEQDEKSRSQQKREYGEVKDLGTRLAGLSKRQLRAMAMSADTRDALLATKDMSRNALQRQFRYIASLLVEEDVAALRAALAGELQPHAQAVATLHEVELWRDKLLSDDPSQLSAFAEKYPGCDLTHIRQLVKNAIRERDLAKPPKSARLLFRYLRQLSGEED